ncbi:hypothetical protein USB125703_00553 [Pseudoclavibacter triregionum]|nr:hypothetical protein USB125703_00553 [Pseudoclavibacter triregionum]
MPVTGNIAEFGGVNVTPGPDAVVQAVGDLATVSHHVTFTPMLSDDHVQTVRGILLSISVEAQGVSFALVNALTDSTWWVDTAAGTLTMADTQPTSLPLGVTSDSGLLRALPTVTEIGAVQASGAVLGPRVLAGAMTATSQDAISAGYTDYQIVAPPPPLPRRQCA